MSWTEGIPGWFRRVDIRLALTLGAIFTPLVAVVLFALYAFAASELLELAELKVHERLARLESALERPNGSRRSAELSVLAEELERDSGGYLVRDAQGRTIASAGVRFESEEHSIREVPLAAAWLTSADHLRARRRMASGQSIEVAIGSAGFVRERDEIRQGFWISMALGIVLVAIASIPATRRALAPLRHATRLAETIEPTRLEARLPSRGTNDDIDRHADAVNHLLERVEAGFERIRHFSDDVAHELRTPVNRLLNEIDVALLESNGLGRSRPELESIRETAEGLAKMIDGLLLIARSEGDRLSVEFSRVEMSEMFRILAEMYEPACEERGLKLEIGTISGAVEGDMALLLRAIGNLVDNAIAYTPPGGSIRVQAEDDDPSSVRIEIADTGPGIPGIDRDRVFERFVRLDSTRPAGGVGLGLAITRSLLRHHGGEVTLETGAGDGARFVIRLPSSECDRSPFPSDSSPAKPGASDM